MGARLQLDPAVNVASLGLDPGEEIVARAMQRHGMYVVESTGSVFALYAESRLSLGHDPYPASWSNGLPKGLIRLMRFVEQPRSPVYDHPGVFGEPRR
jgi:protein-tyrosine phosphatase